MRERERERKKERERERERERGEESKSLCTECRETPEEYRKTQM